MSIQQVSAYRVGEQVFLTIQDAQKKELIDLFTRGDTPGKYDGDIVDVIIEHTDEIVAILTHQPKSKAPRKPRSDIGKKRTSKEEIANQT